MSDRLGGIEGLLSALTGGRDGADGLGALVGKLRQGGMAEEVDSWIGTGANRDVTPDRMEQAFGAGDLAALAQRFGLGGGAQAAGGGAMAAILAQVLPQLINGLTPQGRVPQNDAEIGGGGIGGLLAQLAGGTGGGQPSGGGLAGMLGSLMGGGGRETGGAPAAAPWGKGTQGQPGGGLDKSHLGDGGPPLPRKPRPLG
jgi:uncharacterized protein YidB (DUF937 family)